MKTPTPIGWTHYTINFWWGCTEVSPACKHCYARTFAKYASRHLFGTLVEWGKGKPRQERLFKARQEALALNRAAEKAGTRYRVFANSMSDWLDAEVPIEWFKFILETIHFTPNLDWQLLTKRPENWRKRLEETDHEVIFDTADFIADQWLKGNPPPNVWIGTTVENQNYANHRIPHLLNIPATVRYLSMEPLLGPVDLTRIGPHYLNLNVTNPGFTNAFNALCYHPATCKVAVSDTGTPDGIHWVILGGESGSKDSRPTHPQWFRGLIDQCLAADVPIFLKQWGDHRPANFDDPLKKVFMLQIDSGRHTHTHPHADDAPMIRADHKTTGRTLDGVEYNGFPKSTPSAASPS